MGVCRVPTKAYCLPSPTVDWVLDPGCILQEGRPCWPPLPCPFHEEPSPSAEF